MRKKAKDTLATKEVQESVQGTESPPENRPDLKTQVALLRSALALGIPANPSAPDEEEWFRQAP